MLFRFLNILQNVQEFFLCKVRTSTIIKTQFKYRLIQNFKTF